ncbi:MAG: Flp family type IVb pilin [Candidatus Limnocylindrales bacterium]
MLARYVWLTNLVADLRPRRSDGQGLAEYALILALIAVLAIVALVFLGSQIRSILSRVGNSI